jgi:methylmalonyl-CoA mutase N-terminal domain/subunit
MLKEEFGVTKPEALRKNFICAQCGGSELIGVEVHSNLIRTTVMAMAGLMADVEGTWISSFDEALCVPTEEAVQLSVRTQQILCEETDICAVTDPFGGSYFMEALTNKMEEEILKVMKKMEDLGGYMKCWESGWMRAQVERSCNERLRAIDKGEWVKVGMNKYRVEDISPFAALPRPEAKWEIQAIERVKRYRANRDQEKTDKGLAELREAAVRIDKYWPESCGELFNACVEAARARATAGEMHAVLREVFGYGHFSG